MKAQEVYKLLKDRFPKNSILLQASHWDHVSGKGKECLIHVHDIDPTNVYGGIVAGRGISWQGAYRNFSNAFAEIAITALNDKYKEQG